MDCLICAGKGVNQRTEHDWRANLILDPQVQCGHCGAYRQDHALPCVRVCTECGGRWSQGETKVDPRGTQGEPQVPLRAVCHATWDDSGYDRHVHRCVLDSHTMYSLHKCRCQQTWQ
jgi:hypothetical protein